MSDHREVAQAAGEYRPLVRRNKYEQDWHEEQSWPERMEGAARPLLTVTLRPWEKLAYQWALDNPDHELILEGTRWQWAIRKCDQHVEFGVFDYGLQIDRTWISRWGSRRTLIAVDKTFARKAA